MTPVMASSLAKLQVLQGVHAYECMLETTKISSQLCLVWAPVEATGAAPSEGEDWVIGKV